MQALLDLLPVVAFAVTYWLKDFQTAVLVIMIAMTLQVAVTWLITRTVHRMLLASALLVVVLGGISLVLKNDLIFKWKPTVLNWIFAAAFLISQYIGEKPIVQRVLQSVAKDEISLAPAEWRTLNLMWVVYFLVAGAANIFVAYRYSESVWVNFKLFGLIGLTFAFLLLQGWWLARRPGMTDSGPESR